MRKFVVFKKDTRSTRENLPVKPAATIELSHEKGKRDPEMFISYGNGFVYGLTVSPALDWEAEAPPAVLMSLSPVMDSTVPCAARLWG